MPTPRDSCDGEVSCVARYIQHGKQRNTAGIPQLAFPLPCGESPCLDSEERFSKVTRGFDIKNIRRNPSLTVIMKECDSWQFDRATVEVDSQAAHRNLLTSEHLKRTFKIPVTIFYILHVPKAYFPFGQCIFVLLRSTCAGAHKVCAFLNVSQHISIFDRVVLPNYPTFNRSNESKP